MLLPWPVVGLVVYAKSHYYEVPNFAQFAPGSDVEQMPDLASEAVVDFVS